MIQSRQHQSYNLIKDPLSLKLILKKSDLTKNINESVQNILFMKKQNIFNLWAAYFKEHIFRFIRG